MKSHLLAATSACILIFSISSTADAAILVDKQPNPTGLKGSNVGLDFERVADDFFLSAPADVTKITWYGVFGDTNRLTGDFDILFFEDVGVPSNPPFYSITLTDVTGTDTGIGAFDPIYKWTKTIPTASFSSPGNYWLSIQGANAVFTHPTDPNMHSAMWNWSHADPVASESGTAFQNEGTIDWTLVSSADAPHLADAFAFTLEGSYVPIPPAIWLFGSGLLGILGMARRKMTDK